jgi:hypothetical protein
MALRSDIGFPMSPKHNQHRAENDHQRKHERNYPYRSSLRS